MIKLTKINFFVSRSKLATKFLRKSFQFCQGHNATILELTDEDKKLIRSQDTIACKNTVEMLKHFITNNEDNSIETYFSKTKNEKREITPLAVKEL